MAKKKYYAVYWGRRTGVFDSWEQVKELVLKYDDAKYKGFPTQQEAVDAFRENYAKVQAETKAKRNEKFSAMRAKRKNK
ncbi:RNase H1/viroplasmin domain-containing protein [Vibrio splendidus]|uniref:RNase H1/viroplasmin domain-containing protein n=1 Tax=Vibrio splendidus TaxID=29497 RepID=UPI000C818F66|nr:RNase H1/viroplasmin domain-containing protein [Vibrio splendidus]PMI48863.1 hypothetical protein BCU42_16865 [Vibrio splendidus]